MGEPVGNDTLGAMLGSGCVGTNEPCPSDPSTCCSGYCAPLGGYLTDDMPFIVCSEYSLDAAMGDAGTDALGATLGSDSGCVKTNEPCPADPSTCCSGSCGPMGGYVTGGMPFVCSEASLYAAMEPVGNDTMVATLGSGCVKTN